MLASAPVLHQPTSHVHIFCMKFSSIRVWIENPHRYVDHRGKTGEQVQSLDNMSLLPPNQFLGLWLRCFQEAQELLIYNPSPQDIEASKFNRHCDELATENVHDNHLS